jgi:hypothetical protein
MDVEILARFLPRLWFHGLTPLATFFHPLRGFHKSRHASVCVAARLAGGLSLCSRDKVGFFDLGRAGAELPRRVSASGACRFQPRRGGTPFASGVSPWTRKTQNHPKPPHGAAHSIELGSSLQSFSSLGGIDRTSPPLWHNFSRGTLFLDCTLPRM